MTMNEILLAVLAFVGSLAVKQLMRMAKDIGEIKVFCSKIDSKHDALKEEHDELKAEVRKIREKVYA